MPGISSYGAYIPLYRGDFRDVGANWAIVIDLGADGGENDTHSLQHYLKAALHGDDPMGHPVALALLVDQPKDA